MSRTTFWPEAVNVTRSVDTTAELSAMLNGRSVTGTLTVSIPIAASRRPGGSSRPTAAEISRGVNVTASATTPIWAVPLSW